MNDELKKLFEGSDLSDEFKTKVTEIFEAAVAELVEKEKEQIEESYAEKAEQYSKYVVAEMEAKTDEYIQTELVPVVEKYIEYAAQEHFKETEALVESQLKVELADKFLQGFAGIAESYNVEVPNGAENIVENLQEKLDKMQERFDELLEEKNALEGELVLNKMSAIVDAKVVDLTESQKEKFFEASAKVKFKNEEQYADAIADLYESYFPSNVEDKANHQSLTENTDTTTVKVAKDPWLESLFENIR